MAELQKKSLNIPDEIIDMPGITHQVVEIADMTFSRATHQPGWRWSTHIRPSVGGDWCQVHHVMILLSGRFGITTSDDKTFEFGPDDVIDIPPGHDGYTIGHEPCVLLELGGVRAFTGFVQNPANLVLATLLAVDSSLVVDSLQALRSILDRCEGREISRDGTRMLTTFKGPAQALRCAGGIRDLGKQKSVPTRVCVHVGEVESVGDQLMGQSISDIWILVGVAEPDEIVVTELTKSLAQMPGLNFEDRESHITDSGEWRLFAYQS